MGTIRDFFKLPKITKIRAALYTGIIIFGAYVGFGKLEARKPYPLKENWKPLVETSKTLTTEIVAINSPEKEKKNILVKR